MSLHRWVHSEQNAIDYLAECGCPRELLDPIEKWANQHVVNIIDLELWVNGCGLDGGMWFERKPTGGPA